MPKLLTAYFGELDYTESAVFQFPHGLPGFESERAFLFLRKPQTEPLLFLQSLVQSDLCFILLPILVADPNYRIDLDADDLATLHLAANRQPRIGEEILCAAIIRAGGMEDAEPTVNLLAPVVVNLKQQIGMQVILASSGYSHRHPLAPGKELVPCS